MRLAVVLLDLLVRVFYCPIVGMLGICQPEHDDYLASLDVQRDNTFRAYAKSPEGALVLSDYAEACQIADDITKKTLIGILFDVGNQLYVAFNED